MQRMNIEEIMSEYLPNYNIDGDDEYMMIYKEAVLNLPPADRIIFLLYSEFASYRRVGKILGVSHTIVYQQMKLIRQQIKEWVKLKYPNNDVNSLLECF